MMIKTIHDSFLGYDPPVWKTLVNIMPLPLKKNIGQEPGSSPMKA